MNIFGVGFFEVVVIGVVVLLVFGLKCLFEFGWIFGKILKGF